MKLLNDSMVISPKRGDMLLTKSVGRFYSDETTLIVKCSFKEVNDSLDYIRINDDLNIPLGVLVMTSRGFKPSADLDVGDVLIRYFLDDLPYDAPQKPLRMSEESVNTIKQLKATN